MSSFTFLYTTRQGTYYHLTPFHLSKLQIPTALISAGDFVHMQKVLEKMPFKQYVGMETTKLLYLTAVDSYKQKCIEGLSQKNMVKIQQNVGMVPFSIDQYNKLASIINPEWIVSLTEVPSNNGNKSIQRAIEKSNNFLKKTLQEIPNSKVFAAIQGGLSKVFRSVAIYQTLQLVYPDKQVPSQKYPNFAGFVFYGFNEQWEELEEIIEVSLKELTNDMKNELKFILAGKGDLISILWGANNNFSGFEIEQPYKMAENFQALILPHLEDEKELEQYQNDKVQFFEFKDAKPKIIQFPLKEEDLGKLDERCECFTCNEHSKCYISHLLECKEMNVYVLLSIHNSHQYEYLRKQMNEMQEKNQLNQWIRWMLANLK